MTAHPIKVFFFVQIHDKLKTGAYNPRAYAGKEHLVKTCRVTAEYLRDILWYRIIVQCSWGQFWLLRSSAVFMIDRNSDNDSKIRTKVGLPLRIEIRNKLL
jgi:hypothetical protein